MGKKKEIYKRVCPRCGNLHETTTKRSKAVCVTCKYYNPRNKGNKLRYVLNVI